MFSLMSDALQCAIRLRQGNLRRLRAQRFFDKTKTWRSASFARTVPRKRANTRAADL